ncbi:hypothetical protein BJX61DRAFT_17534 [Aspergillus egyptiacus]|nr:hypothetical protein BJX61DRAFT_17534 [Aspergillus egyptiacus]
MAPLDETIAVIDKSGQVVSTSKQLLGVFSHAKNLYRENRAQVQSERNAKIVEKNAEREALRKLQNYTIDDSASVASARKSRSRHQQSSRKPHRSRAYEQDLHSAAKQADSGHAPPAEIARRHTHHDFTQRRPENRPPPIRSRSDADVDIDMDLAYGDCHPSALTRQQSPEEQPVQQIDDPELNGLIGKVQWLLEEAECVQQTAVATINHLQKRPDAMAAVALALAEISNIANKMAPAALAALKAAAPTIWALLASPQFLIAAGVGLTATIVMFGGFKIIKQLGGPSKNLPEAGTRSEPMDEMLEINTECLSSVEMWRRGVAVAESGAGTSVEGEFITPAAARMSGIDVSTARLQRDPRFKFDDNESRASSHRSHRSHRSRTDRSSREHRSHDSKQDLVVSRRSKTHPKTSSRALEPTPEHRRSEKEPKQKEKKSKSSRLRQMLKV